jgi:ATP-dependent DNA ligase
MMWCSATPARWPVEGIVSKRLGSRYRSGRSPDWLKFKNPEAPAVRREAERSPIREHGADAAKRAVKARRPAESG